MDLYLTGKTELFEENSSCYFVYHKICIKFLVNKTNRCIEFQFYWYYCNGDGVSDSTSMLSYSQRHYDK
jgi:hypothetical protein